MAGPIVFISRFSVLPGQADAVADLLARAAELIDSAKPATSLFAAYLDGARSEARIVHAFADADAMTTHFAGSDDRARALEGLVELSGFELYGAAPVAAVEQLRREAAVAGGSLVEFPGFLGGFLRAGRSGGP